MYEVCDFSSVHGGQNAFDNGGAPFKNGFSDAFYDHVEISRAGKDVMDISKAVERKTYM